MTTAPIGRPCARNLPQHFNGCVCAADPGVTAEVTGIELVAVPNLTAAINEGLPPAFETEIAPIDTVKPGDQISVHGEWAEVSSLTHRPSNQAHLGGYVVHCTNGFNRGLPATANLQVVRADEHGIPALTPTIWHEKMDKGYDSGSPTSVDWCDTCSDYEGVSTSSDGGPKRELCHGCEDRTIAGYEPQTFGSDGGSYVNEHGYDMTPGLVPTGGHL